MSTHGTSIREITFDAVFQALDSTRRRRALSHLVDRTGSTTVGELAAELAASDGTGDESAESARVELRHVHLPALHEADLVEWDRSDATVRSRPHPVLEDDAVRRLIDADDEWSDAVDCLGDRRRRVVLRVLATRDDPMTETDLARVIAGHESAGSETVRTNDVLISLHHVHLPKLLDAGLVDREDGRVSAADHPLFERDLVPTR